MINVVGVKFKNAGKIYHFDPAGINVEIGDNVIVETSRGMEFGTIVASEEEVEKGKIVHPLKKLVRKATENDVVTNKANQKKKNEALKQCQEKVNKHNLDMKLIDVEYTFDNSKIVFFFTSDGRVDFRELVKDLASVFKMRIELRQIGVRDEAKMLGGIGNCGKGLCCHQWLSEFQPVSIKMAKTQGLSLNPTKISGICGRLMCCLKYENDTYLEAKKGMPDQGEKIKTKDGLALVINTNVLENEITTRLIKENNGDTDENRHGGEIKIYRKEEIKRINKNREKRKREEDIPEDIKELLKD